MAKTAPKASKKKVNKKVKRSVRKTFAAVFMITAIVVAAIPVPENLASSENMASTENLRFSDGTDINSWNYGYPADADLNPEAKPDNIDLGMGNDATDEFAYGITTTGDGDQIDWLFRYYKQKPDGIMNYAVISKYNSTFARKELVVPEKAITGFVTVTVAEYENAVPKEPGDPADKTYTVSGIQETGEDFVFINKWFPDAYAQYKEDYLKWQNQDPDGPAVPEPESLVKRISDLSADQMKVYAFNKLCSKYGQDCMLEAIDMADVGASEYKKVYVAKKGEGTVDNGQAKLDGDYLIKDYIQVIALGDNLFKGIQSVDKLTTPTTLSYIGESAFEESYIKSIELNGVTSIGNRAFKKCNQLTKVNVGNALTSIGMEAFYDCYIQEIEIPESTLRIGEGAFAYCKQLKKLDFSRATRSNATIGKYAFYNCTGLSEVVLNTGNENNRNFMTIEEGAFAIDEGGGALEEFTFPSGVTTMGDYMLAGRSNLKKVVMPGYYNAKIPDTTFFNCNSLESMHLSADNGDVTYDNEKLFSTIRNEAFYVKGPKLNRAGDRAKPREITWTAFTPVSNTIPYCYEENGEEYWEISDGTYLMNITEEGVITSVAPRPGVSLSDVDFEVKDIYGTINTTALGDNCFDKDVRNALSTVTIYDDSIDTIGAGVFADCPNLKKVTIGNSVNSIGNKAFENCPKLEEVTFNTPASGYDGFVIAQDSFVTGSSKLTFIADIMDGYAPFEWAMDPANYANSNTSVRVCYRSPEPTNLVVMLDNATRQPTLVDYPRYDDIDSDNKIYIEGKDKRGNYLPDSRIGYFDSLYSTYDAADPERVAWENYRGSYSITEKYENIYEKGIAPEYIFQYLSETEEQIVNSTKHLVVPAGIDSIDIFGFYDSDQNTSGIAAYNLKSNSDKWDAYTKASAKDDVIPGLFSGSYRDYLSGSDLAKEYEKLVKGNDRVESITLNTVQKLPDYAFDSCERLAYVDLGQCTDIGLAPFRGCTSMNTVVGNDNLISYKGIIYEANGDGTYTIITCLGTRGNGVGEASISSKTDSPYIDNVSRIEESAFEDCAYIGSVNLENTKKLRTIPKYCFKNCDNLLNVVLPDSVDTIQDEAFKDNKKINVTIPDVEVEIATSAFEHNTSSVTLYSYEDSAVERYARQYYVGFEALDGRFSVDFLDYDGTQLSERQYVLSGNAAKEPANPVRDGYNFTGWGPSVSNMKPSNITANVTFIAQYKQKDTGNNNNNNNNNNKDDDDDDDDKSNSDNNKNKTYTVTVINGSGSGSYTKDETVTITANAPATGRKFDRWETSSLNVSMANVKATTTTFKMPKNNVVVTATYDSGTGNNTSGSGGSSGSSSSSTNKRPGSSTSGNNTTTSTVTGSGTRQNGTTVAISKPGISNTGLASAVVDGSSDNFVVRITEDPQATAAVERALIAEYGSLDSIRYFPMDISLYDSTGTVKITDTAGLAVNITMPIPDDLITYAGNNKAGAVVGDSTLEKLGATFKTIDGVPCISFLATHFSPYTVYVDTNNLTAGMDSSPKTGDGIHPKWFLAMGLASLSVVLFIKKDKKTIKLA